MHARFRRIPTAATLRAAASICAAAWSIGCGDYGGSTDPYPQVSTQAAAIMTDEPGHRIDRYPGVVKVVGPTGGGCTGWILNERVVVTAAHCLPNEGSSIAGYQVFYMRAGDEAPLLKATDLASVWASNSYAGGTTAEDFFSNPLNPSENDAKHDIGFIKTATRWPGTGYEDYLRVYDDDLSTLTSVYVYGMGSIFRTSATPDPDGKVRFAHFQVDSPLFGSDLVISTTAGQTERLCSGDSGGPYIKKIEDLDLVAGVHHGTDRDQDEFCPTAGGEQWGEKLTWSGPDDFDWLIQNAHLACATYTPGGSGNNYARCFGLPFINDAPEREQEHGGKGSAVAQFVTAVL